MRRKIYLHVHLGPYSLLFSAAPEFTRRENSLNNERLKTEDYK